MKHILVVDDSQVNLVFVQQILSSTYKVTTVSSAIKAIHLLQKESIDLVLLDIAMPEMDGLEAIKIIKSIDEISNVPVIFLTGQSSSNVEIECLNSGAIDFITKPFVPEVMLLRIARTLELEQYRKNVDKIIEEKTRHILSVTEKLITALSSLIKNRDFPSKNCYNRVNLLTAIFIDEIKNANLYKEKLSEPISNILSSIGQIYDIGNTSIADVILFKPETLTPNEFNIIKTHTTVGSNIIKSVLSSPEDKKTCDILSDIALSHHENWDGTGYPEGLKENDISLYSRIIAITSAFDALITKKPYRNAYSIDEAFDIINNERGKKFDPLLTEIFLNSRYRIETLIFTTAPEE